MTELLGPCTLNEKMLEKPDSLGVPYQKQLFIKIADDGEILVKGEQLMLGYFNMERDEFFTKEGFYKTGDLGRIDEEGFLYITGRKKNVILLNNGENVYPEELETLISNITGVREVVVFQWENQVSAIISVEDIEHKEAIENEIHKLNMNIAPYKRVTNIFIQDEAFPKNSSSKIDRMRLLKEFKDSYQKVKIPLNSEKEHYLAGIIKEILEFENEIYANDNFFVLGGNSLLAMVLSAKARINAQLLYDFPVVSELAKVLEHEEDKRIEDESYINELILKTKNKGKKNRVQHILLTGATTKKKIGMEENIYYEVAKKIDTVIHVAANVQYLGNKDEFMKTNFIGTKNMIKLCYDANAELHYASSYVSSGLPVVPIYSNVKEFHEELLFIGQDYKQNIYVHTKYLSEKEIIKERLNGLRANIYRIGSLTSRREDGVFQLNVLENGMINRLRGLLKTGKSFEKMNELPFDLTPVDDCADAFVRLVYSEEVNDIFHLYNPYGININRLSSLYDKEFKLVSKEEIDALSIECSDDKEIAEYVFYTAMASTSKTILMRCEKTIALLKKLGFTWSEPSDEYIKSFIER